MQDIRRNMSFQTVGWFWDLFKRGLLVMDPPYQRRSVWNDEYKNYFVDTVLHGYPAPAIFLFRETTSDGISTYSVVDGKQRLLTLFEFASNTFPFGDERSTISRIQGKYFKELQDDAKTSFWNYRFAVEHLPSSNEEFINNIFDRMNRNIAKLTPQELRHARYSGDFISEVQRLAEWMFKKLPGVLNISSQARRQMKDDEFVAQLLLLIEEGPRKDSQDDLDEAFAKRDQNWEGRDETVSRFRDIIDLLIQWNKNSTLFKTRLRNQADFFSLFGAIHELIENDQLAALADPTTKLEDFVKLVDTSEERDKTKMAGDYFDATRSAAHDTASRQLRIDIIKAVLLGEDI